MTGPKSKQICEDLLANKLNKVSEIFKNYKDLLLKACEKIDKKDKKDKIVNKEVKKKKYEIYARIPKDYQRVET
mgnify:CR=1 FL=1